MDCLKRNFEMIDFSLADIKDIVLTLASIVGMYVALRGLTAWNRQLKGGVEYELTRRLLKCTYRLREAIKDVRNPFIWEIPHEDEGKKISPNELWSREYPLRWDKVNKVRSDLHTEMLEAEVLWGKEVYDQFESLFKLQQELFTTISLYLMDPNCDGQGYSPQARVEIMQKQKEIMYILSYTNPDEYTDKVSKAIAAIETYLKPHLRK